MNEEIHHNSIPEGKINQMCKIIFNYWFKCYLIRWSLPEAVYIFYIYNHRTQASVRMASVQVIKAELCLIYSQW